MRQPTPTDVIPTTYPKEPDRPLDEDKVDELIKSIKEEGYMQQYAIILYPDGTVDDGYCRLVAAQRCGLETIPFIVSRRKRHGQKSRGTKG